MLPRQGPLRVTASAGKLSGKGTAGKAGKKSTAADAARVRRAAIRSDPDPRLSRSLEYGVAILESFSG